MNGIVYDARRIRAYEALLTLGEYAGKDGKSVDLLFDEE